MPRGSAADTGTKILKEIREIKNQFLHITTQQPVDRFLDEFFFNERLRFFWQIGTVGHFNREFINQHFSGSDCLTFCVLYNICLVFRQLEVNSIPIGELGDFCDLGLPAPAKSPHGLTVEQQFF